MSRKTVFFVVFAALAAIFPAFSRAQDAPDIEAVRSELKIARARLIEADSELKSAQSGRDIFYEGYKSVKAESADKDRVIADKEKAVQAAEALTLKETKRADQAEDSKLTLCVWGMAAIFLACFAGAVVCFVMDERPLALRLGVASAMTAAATYGLNYFYRPFALYGVAGLGVLATGGVLYLIYKYRHDTAELERGGIDHANMLGIIKRLSSVPAAVKDEIVSLWYQETGHKADELAAKATGQSVESLKSDADQATVRLNAQ